MDLISVKREYRNRKNIAIAISVLIVIIVFVWLGLKINSNTQNDITKTAETGKNETTQEAEQEEQRKQEEAKKEEERKAKLPQLTDEGRNNLKNIYHSETKRVFLTFDDGPSRTVTPVVLDTLKSENKKIEDRLYFNNSNFKSLYISCPSGVCMNSGKSSNPPNICCARSADCLP